MYRWEVHGDLSLPLHERTPPPGPHLHHLQVRVCCWLSAPQGNPPPPPPLLVTCRDESSPPCRKVTVTSRHHCGLPLSLARTVHSWFPCAFPPFVNKQRPFFTLLVKRFPFMLSILHFTFLIYFSQLPPLPLESFRACRFFNVSGRRFHGSPLSLQMNIFLYPF